MRLALATSGFGESTVRRSNTAIGIRRKNGLDRGGLQSTAPSSPAKTTKNSSFNQYGMYIRRFSFSHTETGLGAKNSTPEDVPVPLLPTMEAKMRGR